MLLGGSHAASTALKPGMGPHGFCCAILAGLADQHLLAKLVPTSPCMSSQQRAYRTRPARALKPGMKALSLVRRRISASSGLACRWQIGSHRRVPALLLTDPYRGRTARGWHEPQRSGMKLTARPFPLSKSLAGVIKRVYGRPLIWSRIGALCLLGLVVWAIRLSSTSCRRKSDRCLPAKTPSSWAGCWPICSRHGS